MVDFSHEALADLRQIRVYIARESPEQAAAIAAAIVAKCARLDRHPYIGRPGREPGTRELSTTRPWVIVYEIRNERPVVLRIWHSRQSRD